jgi:hypothetical protein
MNPYWIGSGSITTDLSKAAAIPVFHFFPNGNYTACNLYWSLGLPCPHCAAEGRRA